MIISMNILLFAAAILHNRPAWYTNDDFRMMTIVSGAYTGTPSADIVFMRYPIGLFLSALYRITTAVPWYGLFTMACMFLPSCIFGYYILKTAGRKHHFLLGILLYILLFGLFIQKYVCLPQFTLTSAFMGVGAVVLLYEMPEHHAWKHLMLAAFCAVLSFSVRSKAFYLLLPVLCLILLRRICMKPGEWKKLSLWGASVLLLCVLVTVIDWAAWNREGYQEFQAFKEARAAVYDYGSIPGYYDNIPFYNGNGISEVTYRAISGRYLDIDDTVNTETLELIADYMKEIRNTRNGFFEQIWTAFTGGLSTWFYNRDQTIKYNALFVTVLLFLCFRQMKKKHQRMPVFFMIVGGMLLEITFLSYIGRVMARLIDLMLLIMLVMGCLTFIEMLPERRHTMKDLIRSFRVDKIHGLFCVISYAALTAFMIVGFLNFQDDLDKKAFNLRETTNSRTEALMDYTGQYPDKFFFYDSNDFIACTGYVFQTYEKDQVLNNASLGSWNSHSPIYYERNRQFGFTTAIEGLISTDTEVYLITTTSPKMGLTKTLKDVYNKKLLETDRIQSKKDILYVYMVVDDE